MRRVLLALGVAALAGWWSSRPASAMGPARCALPDAGLGHGPFPVPEGPVPTNVEFLLSEAATLEDESGRAIETTSTKLEILRTDIAVTRLEPVEPLRAGGRYVVQFVFSGKRHPVVVGEGPDETPPEPPRFRNDDLRRDSYCGPSTVVELDSDAYAFALVGREADGPLGSRELFDVFPHAQREWNHAFGAAPDFDARIVAIDLAGNVSEPSTVVRIETGVGCASSGGAGVSTFGLLVWRRARRRR